MTIIIVTEEHLNSCSTITTLQYYLLAINYKVSKHNNMLICDEIIYLFQKTLKNKTGSR